VFTTAGCIVPRGGPWDLEDQTDKQLVTLEPGSTLSIDFEVHASTGSHWATGFVEPAQMGNEPDSGVLSVSLSGPSDRSASDSVDFAVDDPSSSSGAPGRAAAGLGYSECPNPCEGCRGSDPCTAAYRLEVGWSGAEPLQAAVWLRGAIGGASDDAGPPTDAAVRVEITTPP
jgi:hypothetical protein